MSAHSKSMKFVGEGWFLDAIESSFDIQEHCECYPFPVESRADVWD